MIAAAPIVLEATAEVSDGADELPDGDVEDSPPDAPGAMTSKALLTMEATRTSKNNRPNR
jgi:hypothetical protein